MERCSTCGTSASFADGQSPVTSPLGRSDQDAVVTVATGLAQYGQSPTPMPHGQRQFHRRPNGRADSRPESRAAASDHAHRFRPRNAHPPLRGAGDRRGAVDLFRQSAAGQALRGDDRIAGIHVHLPLLGLSRLCGASAPLPTRTEGAGTQGPQALREQLPRPFDLPRGGGQPHPR